MNDIKSGIKFGEYEVQGKLGKGGMGNVYKALDVSFKRFIALKVTDALENVSEDDIRRFEAEAYAMKNLEHQNITPVYNYGINEDRQYIAMKFVEGKSLAEILTKGKVKLPLVIEYAKQLARALLYAHSKGIVHRDVKPSNIMVQADHHIYLGDFGISFALNQDRLTKAGMAMGTPEYMAPEQCQGLTVDARTDIYAFGIILYEMLFQTPPFTGEKPLAIAYKHVHEKIELPEDVKKIPEALLNIIKKCLIKNMDERFPSMGEILDELDQVSLVTPTVSSVVPKVRKQSTKQNIKVKQKPTQVPNWIVGISILALVISLAGNLYHYFRPIQTHPLPLIQGVTLYQPHNNLPISLDSVKSILWGQKIKKNTRSIEVEFKEASLVHGISMNWSTKEKNAQHPSEVWIQNEKGEKRLVNITKSLELRYYHFQPMLSKKLKLIINANGNTNKDHYELRDLNFLGYAIQ